jgi:hypothetical protein
MPEAPSCPYCGFVGVNRNNTSHHAKTCLDNPGVRAATRQDLIDPLTGGIRSARKYERCKGPHSAGVSNLMRRYLTWDGVAAAFGLPMLYKSTRKQGGAVAQESWTDPRPVSVRVDHGRVLDWDMPLRVIRTQEYIVGNRRIVRVYQEVGPWGGAGKSAARRRAQDAVRQMRGGE